VYYLLANIAVCKFFFSFVHENYPQIQSQTELMLSKNKIKEISALHQKKYRDERALFFAEGNKLVSELLLCFNCRILVATKEWITQNKPNADEIIEVKDDELKKISLLKTPQEVLAVFSKPEIIIDDLQLTTSLNIVLDDIQDPGNLGTIIRIADWYGIEHIFCSTHSVDAYNPKTIQASMGAIARVKVIELELIPFLQKIKGKIPLYGTFLEGENIYQEKLSSHGMIIMGNEGKGIKPEIASLIDKPLFIPNYPIGRSTSESLNVSMATAIICSEFRRRLA
jgi:TrmH family RNA methyltransferase